MSKLRQLVCIFAIQIQNAMYLDVNEIVSLALESPKTVMIYNHLKSYLEEEKVKREQFYNDISEDQKAEFINGEMIIHSPVKFRHAKTSDFLFSLLHIFVGKHSFGYVGHEKLMIRLTRNDYEPDICFFVKEKSDLFKPDQMLFPAPDFVVEVLSKSTEKTDRTIKFEDYALHGVKEYWIIDPEKEIIEQYLLDGEKYFLQQKSGSGSIKSVVIEGFEIPVRAVFDKSENGKVLNNIIAPAE